MMRKLLVGAVAALLPTTALGGIQIDLSSFADGTNLDGVIVPVGSNNATFNYISGGAGLAVFDTSRNLGILEVDPDLIVNLGKFIVIQEDASFWGDQDGAGNFINGANDNVGGSFSVEFTNPTKLLNLTLADINGGSATTIVLTDTQGDTRTYSVPNQWTGEPGFAPPNDGFQLLDLTTLADQPGKNAGIATAAEVGTFDAASVETLTVTFNGSGAVGLITVVPEPAGALLGLIGLAAALRPRRSAA